MFVTCSGPNFRKARSLGRDSYWQKALHLYLGLREDWAFVSVPRLL